MTGGADESIAIVRAIPHKILHHLYRGEGEREEEGGREDVKMHGSTVESLYKGHARTMKIVLYTL